MSPRHLALNVLFGLGLWVAGVAGVNRLLTWWAL